uniref:RuvB-like helicase 1 n=1 Tax=Anthurium amnicola TaxID=1678845 RepID=A0A1D1XJI1_9ARAE
MSEIKGNPAGGAKAKVSLGRDDRGKGKAVGTVASPPAPGKKKLEGLGGKGQPLPHAKLKTLSSVIKSVEVKGKTSVSSSAKALTKTTKKTTAVRVKAVKKVYTLHGQKYDPPEEREPLRIFYESLSKQIPSSEMAEVWMMEHGLLSPEKAKKAHEKKQKRQQQLRTGTPIKSSKPQRPESSKKPQVLKNGDIKTRKRMNYSDDDDDFILKHKKARS